LEQTETELRRELEERLQFETLLADISARFVNLPTEQIDGEIEDAQGRICECLGVDLSALWQWSDETPCFMTITHLHSPPEGPSRPEGIDAQEAFPWVLQKMLAGEILLLSTEEMPPEAARDCESRRYFGVKSSVVIPLSTGGGPNLGVLTFDTLRAERSWSEETVKRLTLIALVFTNALARKHSDESLRNSEARLSLAADSAEAGLWELGFSTRLFWATERARQIFGYGPDEVINMERVEASIYPDDIGLVRQSIARALNEREPVNIEYRILADDDCLKWISFRGRPHFKSTGEPDHIMGVSLDISERKRMEEQLNERLAEVQKLKLQLEKENLFLREELGRRQGFGRIIGSSDALNYVLFRVEQVAPTDATVLILGETGTGKGLIASALHSLSPRKDRPIITVNCAALPANLIESELFGREKGAFTGAHARQTGRFEVGDGGTIFLDEIGELPLELQSKLLRVLQDGEFERLGSAKTIKVDVRVIASTSRDLKTEILKGRFREDLFYRLNVFPVTLPPLRKRIEDIPQLVHYFVDKYSSKFARKIETIPKAVIKILQDYPWPGNVRELEHVIERNVILTSGPVFNLRERCELLQVNVQADEPLEDLAAMERQHILRVLRETEGKIEGPKGAAAILKLHPSTLRFRIKKLGIKRA